MSDVQIQIGADTTQLETGLRRGGSALAGFKAEVKGLTSLTRIGGAAMSGFGTLGIASSIGSMITNFQQGIAARRGEAFRSGFPNGGLASEFAAQGSQTFQRDFSQKLADVGTYLGLGLKTLGTSVFGTAEDMNRLEQDITNFGVAVNGATVELSEGFQENMKALAIQQRYAQDQAIQQAALMAGRLNRPGSGYTGREAIEFIDAVRAMKDAASMLKAVALARENVAAGRALGAPRDAAARSASLAP